MKWVHHFLTIIAICALGLLINSCGVSPTQLPDKYKITAEKLDSLISRSDTSIIVFYTSWCGGAKQTINQFYREAQDSIKSRKLNKKIILLLADERVDTSELEKYRNWGMSSYYIPSSGTSALGNRYSIKRFIKKCFPEHHIEWLGLGFGIPAQIIVAPDKTIINEKDSRMAFKFVVEQIEGGKVVTTTNN
ncbi:hypothetical protein [Pedobacter panaciterrae]|uniref:hypothetical protein n=1 Tax=Pedobacter panaciterrae TaxID=363849 RepID=UPI002595CE1B|nr:hypothetical protein [uncultured Pedobacter sp.]